LIYNCLVVKDKVENQAFFSIESDSEVRACESIFDQGFVSCGDVIVVDHESYFICLAVGWMPVSEKVYNFWIEHDLQDRKMHPLIWSKSPIETLINIANMEEGFLFRK